MTKDMECEVLMAIFTSLYCCLHRCGCIYIAISQCTSLWLCLHCYTAMYIAMAVFTSLYCNSHGYGYDYVTLHGSRALGSGASCCL